MVDEKVTELWERIKPSIKTRRLTEIAFFFGALIIKLIFKVPIPNLVLFILGVWFLSSFGFAWLIQKQLTAQQMETVQVRYFLLELLFLTCIIHYIGGVEWIGVIFYIFTIIYSNIILSKRNGLIVGAAAFGFYVSLVLLEYFAILPHRELFVPVQGLYRDPKYLIVTIGLGSFGVFYLVSYTVGIFANLLKKKSEALAGAIKELELLAETDGLTRLYNHRYFQEALEGEIERARRYKRKVSLIMLDIDHFKNYNDTYGHPKGDIVLNKIAQILKKNVRRTDTAARYGGEELTLILPEIEQKRAVSTAERLRKLIEDYSFPGGKITASFGVATYPEDAQTRADLIEQADKSLYKAKEAGRNRVGVS